MALALALTLRLGTSAQGFADARGLDQLFRAAAEGRVVVSQYNQTGDAGPATHSFYALQKIAWKSGADG